MSPPFSEVGNITAPVLHDLFEFFGDLLAGKIFPSLTRRIQNFIGIADHGKIAAQIAERLGRAFRKFFERGDRPIRISIARPCP